MIWGPGRAGWEFECLLAGRVGVQDLDRPLADFYHLGFFDGRVSLTAALVNAENAADRYYRRAFNHDQPATDIPAVTFAELCRVRGEGTRAEAVEADLERRFAPVVPGQ